jgi:hypothetical protein
LEWWLVGQARARQTLAQVLENGFGREAEGSKVVGGHGFSGLSVGRLGMA